MSVLPLPQPQYSQSWAAQLVASLERESVKLAALQQRIQASETLTYTASRAMATDGSGALTASSVTSTELGYLSGVTSAVQTQFGSINTQIGTINTELSNKQPLDGTLTALAGLDTSGGLVTQTIGDVFTKRSLVAPAAGFTIANNTGVSGNPTFALSDDLAAVEALATTGAVERTASNTWGTFTVSNNSKTLLATTTNSAFQGGLGLGLLATKNYVNNDDWFSTYLSVSNGATGASDADTARTNLGCGTAATANTGTSGGTVPLLNGANTHSGATIFSSTVVFNEAAADVDYRFEGVTKQNLLFTDASTDRVGVGTATPSTSLHVSDTSARIRAESTTSSSAFIDLKSDGTGLRRILGLTSADSLQSQAVFDNGFVLIAGSTTTAECNLNVTGGISSASPTVGIGYAAGAGGTVTQITSKATGVTLNKTTGQITMHNAALAAGAEVSFTLTNSTIGANDVVYPVIKSGATANTYGLTVDSVVAGSCRIQVTNRSTTSRSEAIVLQFVVIRGAIA